jgi:tetratricopeptide (TPR) repeat protein
VTRIGLTIGFLALAACATTTPAERAKKDDKSGMGDLDEGRSCKALKKFRKAVDEDPDNLAALRHTIEGAKQCGELDATTQRARKEVANEPNSARAHYVLGLCLLAASRGEEHGLDELREARRLDPRSGELALRLGIALMESERFKEALDPLRDAVKLEGSDPHPHFPLAVALHRSGENAAAIATLAEALQGEPDEKDLENARKLLDLIHDPYRNFPEKAKGRFSEGMGWLDRSDVPQRAIDIFEALQTEYPQLAGLQSAMGLAYQRLGDTAQAVEHFERASQLDPTLPEPHLYLGELYYGLRRYEQAAAEYDDALTQDPLMEAARERLAQLAAEEGDLKMAAQQLRALVALKAGDPGARLALTQVLVELGDLRAAETQLQAVLDKDPKSLQAKLSLGMVAAKRAADAHNPDDRQRFSEKARKLIQEVLAVQPDNVAASRVLASLDKK